MRNSGKSQAPTKNEQPFNVVDHHTKNFYKTIEDFYELGNASDFTGANNDLLNSYLEKDTEEKGYCPKDIQNLVFMVTFQNQFLTALKENWELYKTFTNTKTENL